MLKVQSSKSEDTICALATAPMAEPLESSAFQALSRLKFFPMSSRRISPKPSPIPSTTDISKMDQRLSMKYW